MHKCNDLALEISQSEKYASAYNFNDYKDAYES